MSFTQTKEIIRHCRRDHLKLSESMDELEDIFTRPKTKSISHFCSNQQKHMADYLKCFLDSSPKEVLNSWFQSTPEMGEPLLLLDDLPENLKEIDFEKVVHRISKVFELRYEAYSKISELAKTRELFTQLSSVNNHASSQFHWSLTENRDL
ncbi:hypothetical protein PQO03_16895 [Lentisphaera profundi]|uniref:Uncharacterized protein n=1 Tax=Lentisphaera profundi TaxID=1658616 RepID=A0ABY7VUW8_9BACT|nr:hypothetical protein [Lentisphaera profundi]WDE97507.1 hypothetical protein PQO03_16895 [Lentisphaera profundi]